MGPAAHGRRTSGRTGGAGTPPRPGPARRTGPRLRPESPKRPAAGTPRPRRQAGTRDAEQAGASVRRFVGWWIAGSTRCISRHRANVIEFQMRRSGKLTARMALLRPFRALWPRACCRPLGAVGLAVAALLGPQAAAQQMSVDSAADAVTEGRLLLELRPRYADIWDAGLNERGHAWTMRSTVGWQTATFDDFRAVVEGIHTDLVDAHHLSTDLPQYYVESLQYPLLPDPRETDTNRVYLEYLGLPDTRVRLGKQPIRLDNERFFSDVDFRQTPMLFNGLTVVNNSLPDTEVYAALLNRIRTVFATQVRTRIWLVRVAYSPAQDQSIAAYGFGLNQPLTSSDTDLADNSHQVFGLRAEGAVATGLGFAALYTAEAAHQRHY